MSESMSLRRAGVEGWEGVQGITNTSLTDSVDGARTTPTPEITGLLLFFPKHWNDWFNNILTVMSLNIYIICIEGQ